MMYQPSITVDAIIDILADFLTPFTSGAEIVRAQSNRTPMPHSPCVVLTELLQVDLSTPVDTWRGTVNEVDVVTPTRIDVQIDFYGPNAGDQCKAVKGVYRSIWATGMFPDGVKPLYCDDGKQTPLITGEQQWQQRWTLTASLQYNAKVVVPHQFADEAEVAQTTAADLT